MFGGPSPMGIKILVSVDRELTKEERSVISQKVDEIENLINATSLGLSPKVRAAAAKERADLVALFPEPIFVEPIPNAYCSRGCCVHRPWFIVTTGAGRIKIGWRKRVIHIDWGGSAVTAKAEELFPAEDVTKFDRAIHAWSLDKAREYINVLLGNVTAVTN